MSDVNYNLDIEGDHLQIRSLILLKLSSKTMIIEAEKVICRYGSTAVARRLVVIDGALGWAPTPRSEFQRSRP